jgi:hypothetical protein
VEGLLGGWVVGGADYDFDRAVLRVPFGVVSELAGVGRDTVCGSTYFEKSSCLRGGMVEDWSRLFEC